jgi:hypothetical protein
VSNATALGRGTMEMAVNGASSAQNTFMMDGVSIVNAASSGVDTEGGTYATFGIPNPDALAEFKIQTSLYDAGYGRNPGANVNVITKSGTNEFHGTAFEFFRNTVLNANDFFRNRNCAINEAPCLSNGGNKQALDQNQFGGVIGGPIKRQTLLLHVLSADVAEKRRCPEYRFHYRQSASAAARPSQYSCLSGSSGRGILPQQPGPFRRTECRI